MGDFHELKLGFRRVWAPVETHQAAFGTFPGVPGSNSRVRPYVPVPARSPAGSSTTQAMSPQRATPSVHSTPAKAATTGGSGDPEGTEMSPGVRFCHVGVVYEGAFYIFGGYDGTQRYVCECSHRWLVSVLLSVVSKVVYLCCAAG